MRRPPRWPASSAPSRATRKTPNTCCGSCATTAAPPMARTEGYEGLNTNPVALGPRLLPGSDPDRTGSKKAWDRASGTRRSERLPQRPVHRDRPDRHDRPGHGLRHHRHRTGLRPGEVQEAGRWRLLQDHQPRRSRSPAQARLFGKRDRRDRSLCGRPRLHRPGAGHQPGIAEGQGLCRREPCQAERRHEVGLRHQVRLQPLDPRRRADESAWRFRGTAGRHRIRLAVLPRLLQGR